MEEHSRALFEDSVAAVDMRVQSRLTQARHAALSAAVGGRARVFGMPRWSAFAGAAATAVLAVGLWFAWSTAAPPPGASGGHASFEDLDIVASTDHGHVNTLDMMQEDANFYAWAVANADQAGTGSGHAG